MEDVPTTSKAHYISIYIYVVRYDESNEAEKREWIRPGIYLLARKEKTERTRELFQGVAGGRKSSSIYMAGKRNERDDFGDFAFFSLHSRCVCF